MRYELRHHMDHTHTELLSTDDLIDLSFAAANILDPYTDTLSDDAQKVLDAIIRHKHAAYQQRWENLEQEISVQGFPPEAMAGEHRAFWRKADSALALLYSRLVHKPASEIVRYASMIGIV